jgi:hypothetical protein
MSLRKYVPLSLCVAFAALPSLTQAALYITVVQGLGGMPQYDDEFAEAREQVEAASASMTDKDKVFTFAADRAKRSDLLKHFADLKKKMTADDRAAIYLIGHGSFDGEVYKFNIPGPDLTAADFKSVMEGFPGRNHFLVNTGSTSGAMLEAMVGKGDTATSKNYIVISATRNGNERNATHFGRYFAEALTSPEADINKNNSISIQEAYDYADKHVKTLFEDDGKLATEHSQLRGEGAAAFNLSRLNALEIQQQFADADDELSALLKQRADLDAQIENLQLQRTQLDNADYLAKLQQLVLQSAELSEKIDAAQKKDTAEPPKVDVQLPPIVPEGTRAF